MRNNHYGISTSQPDIETKFTLYNPQSFKITLTYRWVSQNRPNLNSNNNNTMNFSVQVPKNDS